MRFEATDLALLDAIEEIEIETAGPDGATHRTIIWVVVDDDDAFVRSVNGPRARWYREAVAVPQVTVHADGSTIRGQVEAAADPDSIERTSAALRRKYATDPSLGSMLEAHTLDTTLRLVPSTQQG